ncbi:MAG: M18 family aminopeptidase [Oscillospiraceae bacterium]|nr:M18 family aminopeptidase [Oscillospiraceae bacterium]
MDKRVSALMGFLDQSHSVYHAVKAMTEQLRAAGYTCLQEAHDWSLVPGGRYYLTRGESALIAFRLPEGTPKGFLMSASHSDRPGFKVKENGELVGTYTRLAVERYGGMLMSTWLDRPLSIAGRVLVETPRGVESRLVDMDKDLLLIPNVAIHMNRKANEGYSWNPAVDMLPLLGGKDAAGKLLTGLEEMAGGRILGHDLYLYVRQKASVWGIDGEYLSAQALDDLACTWGCMQGFLKASGSAGVPVLCVFDSEEVGSGSLQGAASDLLEATLNRICQALGLNYHRMLAQSFMVSADNGHAVHPNHPEYADATNAPVPGEGVVLKYNAAQRYTTDGVSAALLRKLCMRAGVPVQAYCNRADLQGGSTLGNISLTHVSVPSVDIGLAQLAMHSCYETVAVRDTVYLEQAMEAYFSATLEHTADGIFALEWHNYVAK